MKLLDRYILSTYLKSFFSVFTILMFIFLLQSIWVYISELAGKDLEIEVILKFLLYVSPRIVVLVLPLTILLVSIMVFGNFSENYEFAAMKSTGISLQRAMKSLSIFIVFLSIISFFFANNVIPLAEYNFFNLRRNIARVKPAMAIAEGQFNQLQDINIKVAKKSGENGQFLKDVIIHQKKGNSYGNYTVIKSKTGEFFSNEDSDLLQLVLFDGNYYDELQPANYQKRTKNRPQIKSTFDKYTINIDISQFNDIDFDQKETASKYNMLGVSELSTTIDSLYKKQEKSYASFSKTMLKKLNQKNSPNKQQKAGQDSLTAEGDIVSIFPVNKTVNVLEYALKSVKNIEEDLKTKTKSHQISTTNINKHIIAFHDKFALGLMCIVLFFVGAPLGALIRKGGIGLPMVIAILIFLTYHFISIFAKNSSEDSSLNPVFATWLAGLIMMPFSIYLTSRATKDRALIDLDAILIPLKKYFVKSHLITLEEKPTNTEAGAQDFQHFETTKLIDLIKNYRHYGLSLSHKNKALEVLKIRGISELELKISGNLSNETYESGIRFLEAYHENATLAAITHTMALAVGILGWIFKNNGLELIGILMLVLAFFAAVLFLIILPKVFKNQSEFYNLLKKKFMTNNIVFIVLGFCLFFLYRLYFNKKMKEDLFKIS
ncbi:MAG: permease [Flavobacteriaceae bacterium]|nr:permease [Flavobacteriaceae bacterium]